MIVKRAKNTAWTGMKNAGGYRFNPVLINPQYKYAVNTQRTISIQSIHLKFDAN